MSKSTFFTGQPIFSQLLSLLPKSVIHTCVKSHQSDRYYKKFKSLDHVVTMLYACFQKCTSLREVTTGLLACHHKLNHLGLTYVPRRSTLAEANQRRSADFFSDLYHGLYRHHFTSLPDSRIKNSFENRLFLIDSTTISLFSEVMKGMGTRAVNGKKKGGAKAHLLVKATEDVPRFVLITHASKSDKEIFSSISLPKGAIVVFDKGYNSYQQFKKWDSQSVTWVTRMSSLAYQELIREKEVGESEQQEGILSDHVVRLGRPSNHKTIKIQVRKIRYYDKEHDREFTFITNNQRLKASTIAQIYKRRWQIELLFKRLKQSYPLQYFLGESENAIKIQIWSALITDLLIKIIQRMAKRKWSFANISSMLRLHLMNYLNILNFLNNPEKSLRHYSVKEPEIQIKLFG
jgi:hypothetical protein